MKRRMPRLLKRLAAHRVVLKRVLVIAFAVLVLALLAFAVAKVDWLEVIRALRELPAAVLFQAAGFAVAAYALYSAFDLFGRAYTGHSLAWWRSVLVGFISYAFTMSIGSTLGGVGLRMRLYAKQGLRQSVVFRIWAISVLTNWTGYLLALGLVLVSGHVALPQSLSLGRPILIALGAVCIGLVSIYVVACSSFQNRSWTIRGQRIELPAGRLALMQLGAGTLVWMLIAGIPYVLFQARVPYLDVLGIVLISAVAGLAARVPGGIGVVEYVFLTMLGPSIARYEILAVMLMYRLFYYIGPLLIAGVGYLAVEAGMRTAVPEPSGFSSTKDCGGTAVRNGGM